ncbi:hypothetical protein ACJ5H2_17255 [Nocardioides sp. R1-1]|uniref:hypothetical protein n=1 Tax=Nocardioides sp. R1-1 TaxID=3383502 RepID=UPI0038D08296
MSETLLSERITALADDIAAPATAPYDDLVRGRRRVRRRRARVAAGTLVVVTGAVAVGALVPGPGAPDRVATDPAGRRPHQPTAVEPERLVDRITSLRRDRGHAITVRDLQAVSDAMAEGLAGPLGWLSVGAAPSWQAAGADTCPAGWTCADATVRGADRARWAHAGTVHQLAVDFDGRVDVFTVNQVDARPAEVAWATP